MKKLLPIVAIVGQPNAGKSTLLNKIAGQRLAVTSDLAGTTRDRQYIDTQWNGVHFTLADTAGINLAHKDELEHNLHKQIEIALEQADMLVMVADGRLNSISIEPSVVKKFQKNKKPLVLALNKLDSPLKWEERLAEFASLGIKPTFPVSAINGRGIGDLLDYIAEQLTKLEVHEKTKDEITGIAVGIIGKPNVGKSSIFNQILKEERVVVSPIAGTTRTAIDSLVEFKGDTYTFIDTAGLKRKSYNQEEADVFGGFQTFRAVRRSDVCFLVIDATEEITKQDQHIASEIFELQKGVVILANKIDVYEGNPEKLRDYVSFHLPFLWMCPLFFVSGLTGQGMEEALSAVKPIWERRSKKIDDQTLSEFLKKLMKINPPKLLRDQKTPKVFSLHQIDINPPKFELVVNHPAAISQQFRKFVENSIIKELDFYGTPIMLRLRGKDKT